MLSIANESQAMCRPEEPHHNTATDRTASGETLSPNGVFSQEEQCSVCLQATSSIIPTPGL